MIEKLEFNCWDVYCDRCERQEYLELTECHTFNDVISEIKERDWFIKKVNGEWEHYCYNCKEGK